MADTSPHSRCRRGQQLEVLPSQTGPEPWIRAVMTVPLAELGFWCLNAQLAAGVEVNAATAAVATVLLYVGQVCGIRCSAPRPSRPR